jgi:hypothetical protein
MKKRIVRTLIREVVVDIEVESERSGLITRSPFIDDRRLRRKTG